MGWSVGGSALWRPWISWTVPVRRRRGGGAVGDVCEGRHAEIDCGESAGCFGIELVQLSLRAGEADLETLDFAQPSFPFRLGDPGDQAVTDVSQP
ncbi:hypothetical protein [Streptomyces sp. NPDC001930]|uniref:hypothetical protein n=1 Tax=Streptomyces sp. NPDC001930 TaxID=3364625 RepID=UPI0036CC410F